MSLLLTPFTMGHWLTTAELWSQRANIQGQTDPLIRGGLDKACDFSSWYFDFLIYKNES